MFCQNCGNKIKKKKPNSVHHVEQVKLCCRKSKRNFCDGENVWKKSSGAKSVLDQIVTVGVLLLDLLSRKYLGLVVFSFPRYYLCRTMVSKMVFEAKNA